MNVLLVGATGFLGRPLCRALAERGHALTVAARDTERSRAGLPARTEVVAWEGGDGAFERALAQAEAVINLAGAPIAGARWTPAYKETLRSSRIEATRRVVEGLAARSRAEGVTLVNASAVGYYGDRGDEAVTEDSPPGRGFLPDLCAEWEREARRAEAAGVRVALPRIGIALAADGGALPQMAAPFRFFVGGPLGSGRQWVPWVHRDDVIHMIAWALETPAVRGPFNATAPEPVTARAFAAALGRVLRRPSLMPAPGFALRQLLGEFAESLLAGQKAVPSLAQRLGYRWLFPELDPALRAIYARPPHD